MRFLSLFAGIGGFDLGLERSGMECVGQVEIDPYCQAVLAKHWPHVKRMGDIREVKGNEFGSVDLVCGGFPCQPFSSAGKRRGKADDRFLWPEMLRVIETIRPSWIIGENVAGLISLGLDEVLANLESKEYACRPFIIPACALNAPHRRDRVWIMARDSASPGAVTFDGVFEGTNADTNGVYQDVADSLCKRSSSERNEARKQSGSWKCGENVADSNSERLSNIQRSGQDAGFDGNGAACGAGWWDVEPGMGRVADGISRRVDRLKCLGNAVVPQVVEEIGKAIMQSEERAKTQHITKGLAAPSAKADYVPNALP